MRETELSRSCSPKSRCQLRPPQSAATIPVPVIPLFFFSPRRLPLTNLLFFHLSVPPSVLPSPAAVFFALRSHRIFCESALDSPVIDNVFVIRLQPLAAVKREIRSVGKNDNGRNPVRSSLFFPPLSLPALSFYQAPPRGNYFEYRWGRQASRIFLASPRVN